MEESHETIVEAREELMFSPTGGEPILRTAHFLKPTIASIDGPVAKLPLQSLSSFPPTSEPKNWPLRVLFNGWRFPPKNWNTWVQSMASLHEPTWKRAGIYEAILASTYEIQKNVNLVLGVAEKWCPETKTFVFPWAEATITLEDVMISLGYSVLGSPVFSPLESRELEEVMEKLDQARIEIGRTTAKKACQGLWMKKFMESGSEIEHEAFLIMWLSRFVLPSTLDVIMKCVIPIAIHLARGTRIAFAPAVLASIYRDLNLLKKTIVASSKLEISSKDKDALSITLWSPFQLVQIWAWERFPELRPKPKKIENGEPRLARWDGIKGKVENVRLVLDLAKESFDWRPYAKILSNWNLPKFYGEKEMRVLFDPDIDDEYLSFARCLRPSELVGLNCREQYLPNRVALQFGIDQDLPGCVARSNESPEIAWRNYNKAISDVMLYIPSRLSVADITTRYLDWWKQSVSVMQSPKVKPKRSEKTKEGGSLMSFESTPKTSKRKKEADCFTSFKITPKNLEGTKEGDSCTTFKITPKNSEGSKEGDCFASFKITPKSSKGANEDDGASTHLSSPRKSLEMSPQILKRKKESKDATFALDLPLKRSKTLVQNSKGKDDNNEYPSPGSHQKSLKKSSQSSKGKKEGNNGEGKNSVCKINQKHLPPSLIVLKELNNSPFPPGFHPKCNRVEAAGKSVEEDQLTIAEIMKSGGKQDEVGIKEVVDSGNYSCHRQRFSSNSVTEDNLSTTEILKSRKDGKDVGNSSGRCQRLPSDPDREDNLIITEMLRSSNKQDGLWREEEHGHRENSSGKSQSPSPSIADNGAVKDTDLMDTLVKKATESEAVTGGSERSIQDAMESKSGSLIDKAVRINGTEDGSSYKTEVPVLELEARISRLERMVAKLKRARFGK